MREPENFVQYLAAGDILFFLKKRDWVLVSPPFF